MNLRISDFCHFVEGINNLTALYNALTLDVVIVDKETAKLFRQAKHKIISYDQINSLDDNLVSELTRHKLVFPLDRRLDLEEYAKIQTKFRNKEIGILYLLMTDVCNLACIYCFIEGAIPENYQFSKMSTKTAQFGIDLFAKLIGKNSTVETPQIIFYGGEPFLNFEVVERMLRYIESLKSKKTLPSTTFITINTNGALINETIALTLRSFGNVNVAVSLDGPKEIHDKCRRRRDGHGSFDDTIRGYQLLVKNGVNTGICCTISQYNVEQLEEISKWFVNELGATSISFNILIESIGIEGIRGDAKVYAEKVAKQIIKCYRFFREKGIYEDRIMRKVNAFVEGYIYYNDCGGCGEQIVIAPDGMVGVCQGYCGSRKYFIHPDITFDPFNHPIWEEWKFRSPLFMEQCYNCIALSICGGGCPYSAYKSKGSIWEVDDIFCVHAKATAEFLIRDLIEKMDPKTSFPSTEN
ncbi:MAG: radical SAM protein [Candidatus Pacebacteria bacterium]|nr:radical SAM protein [Candidatus Paceibacterota bacterium]